MNIVNLTPHTLVILVEDPDGEIEGTTGTGPSAVFVRYRKVAEIPPSGIVAQARQKEEMAGYIKLNRMEIPIIRKCYEEPVGIPPTILPDGMYYYVPKGAAHAASTYNGRLTFDLIWPEEIVYDSKGRIIGITKFGCF